MPPAGPWIAALHALWGETWTPRLRLGQKARIDEEERIRLDEEQVRILDCVKGNQRMLVEGAAGTGKTLLAREAAVRMAAEGWRVLLLCFTDALAGWLATHTTVPRVSVATVRRCALELDRRCGMPLGDTNDPEFWEQVLLLATVDGVCEMPDPPQFVILDEGQDLGESDWAFVGELCRDRPLWIFRDPVQAFWREHRLPPWATSFPIFRLPKPYRCPPAVMALAELYSGAAQNLSVIKHGFQDGTLGLAACHHEGQLADKVALEIDKLLSEGLKPQDIEVISLRGQSAEGVAHLDRLGRHRLVRASDPAIEDTVVGDTFLRFKGLERPAIIVTDLGLVHDRLGTRMHIALTRAQLLVRIVAPLEDLQHDPLLAPFCT